MTNEPKGQQTKVVVSAVVRNDADGARLRRQKVSFCLFSVDLLSFWRGEWRCRRGRNGRRKIAIDDHQSMAQLSSSRLMPTGPSHPGNPPSMGSLGVFTLDHQVGLTSKGVVCCSSK
jgi:hypothetical protein